MFDMNRIFNEEDIRKVNNINKEANNKLKLQLNPDFEIFKNIMSEKDKEIEELKKKLKDQTGQKKSNHTSSTQDLDLEIEKAKNLENNYNDQMKYAKNREIEWKRYSINVEQIISQLSSKNNK